MSDVQTESVSSVTIKRTARGDRQVEVKVYAGTHKRELERIRDLAIAQFVQTERGLNAALARSEVPSGEPLFHALEGRVRRAGRAGAA